MIIDNIEDSERIDEFLEAISEKNLENHELKNDDSPEEINILREKTFNVELRSLVNRITENESPGSFDELDNITESELLIKLHRLFYKVKNLHALDSINTSFNPFLVDKTEGVNFDFLIKLINDEIKNHALFLELVLSYKIDQKCFSVSHGDPLSGTEHNIAINLEDKFYKKIIGGKKGVILNQGEVSKNPYLKNNFFPLFNDEESSLYLISLNRLIKDFSDEWNRNVPDKIFSIFLSKILIFKFKKSTISREAGIFELLQRKLSIPLFLLDGGEENVFKLDQYNDIHKQLNLVECFYQLLVQENSGMGILIRLMSPFNKKSLYNFKYLQSKIAHFIGENSIVFRISSGRMLIITDKLKIESVLDLINEYNILFDYFLDIELLFEDREYSVSDLLNHVFIE